MKIAFPRRWNFKAAKPLSGLVRLVAIVSPNYRNRSRGASSSGWPIRAVALCPPPLLFRYAIDIRGIGFFSQAFDRGMRSFPSLVQPRNSISATNSGVQKTKPFPYANGWNFPFSLKFCGGHVLPPATCPDAPGAQPPAGARGGVLRTSATALFHPQA